MSHVDDFLHADIVGVREAVIKLGTQQGLTSGTVNHILDRMGRIEKESATKEAVDRIESKLDSLDVDLSVLSDAVQELRTEIAKKHKTKKFYFALAGGVIAIAGAFDGLAHITSYLINYYK